VQRHELRHEVFEIRVEMIAKLATDKFFDLMTTRGAPRVTEENRSPMLAMRKHSFACDARIARRAQFLIHCYDVHETSRRVSIWCRREVRRALNAKTFCRNARAALKILNALSAKSDGVPR
jgi:hypothetical protein